MPWRGSHASPPQTGSAQKQLSLWAAFSSKRKLVAELGRFLLSVVHLVLAETVVLLRSPDVVVGYPLLEHVRHRPGELVRRGNECLGGAPPPRQVPGGCPKRAVGASHRLGRQAEGLGSTVMLLPRAAPQDCAPGDVLLGRQAQPGAAVCGIGPLAYISADLG